MNYFVELVGILAYPAVVVFCAVLGVRTFKETKEDSARLVAALESVARYQAAAEKMSAIDAEVKEQRAQLNSLLVKNGFSVNRDHK